MLINILAAAGAEAPANEFGFMKAMEEDKFLAGFHHGFGTWLHNTLELWHGSPLAKHFNELGI